MKMGYEKEVYELCNQLDVEVSDIQRNILNILFPRLRFVENELYFAIDDRSYSPVSLEERNGVSFRQLTFYTESEAEWFMGEFDQRSKKMNKKKMEIHDYVMNQFEKYGIIEELRRMVLREEVFYDFEKKNVDYLFRLLLPFRNSLELTEENGYQKEKIVFQVQMLKTRQIFLQIAKQYDPYSFISFLDGIGRGAADVVLFGKVYRFPLVKEKIMSYQDLEKKVKGEKLRHVFEPNKRNILVPHWFKRLTDKEKEEEIFSSWLKERFQDRIVIIEYEHEKEFENFLIESFKE